MPSTMSPVAAKALNLAPLQRMGLATLLLDSLEDNSGVEKKLLRELTKRANELRSGKVKGLTTKEAYGFSLKAGPPSESCDGLPRRCGVL